MFLHLFYLSGPHLIWLTILNPFVLHSYSLQNINTGERCEICSNLTIKTPEWLMFLLLTLNNYVFAGFASIFHVKVFQYSEENAAEYGTALKYSGLSLSPLLSVSNFSLFRTKISVPWTFVCSLSYFYLFMSNFSISNFSLSRTKILVPYDYFSLYLEPFPV